MTENYQHRVELIGKVVIEPRVVRGNPLGRLKRRLP